MQLSTILLGALAAASTTLAAPAADIEARAVPAWTITGYKRTCNAADTSCTVTFGVDTHLAAATPCSFTLTGSPASHASTSGKICGPYTVSSGWSGQFGPGNGFTTLSVVDFAKKLIVWPAYSDSEAKNGVAVTPDKSYAPSAL
ncbi:hypothetical protein B0H66DRAFT_182897 [Apodospora peruviana]|uniref:Small secreted protein n=1 Tax=Apodospora peruviana TaxID=516989 RepID=A0AAE0IBK1_9PEZI|nr:hypothetical protein B0H66DRAFT_182897 [Apodospora peruviana]